MKVVADLHLHSKYSRAVSKHMEPQIMAEWAKKKGIDLLATGDWTHPLWLKELESKLDEVGEGIFQLKSLLRSSRQARFAREQIATRFSKRRRIKSNVSMKSLASANLRKHSRICSLARDPRFILSTEISSIYSQGGKGRRIHNLVIAPSFKIVYKINKELKKRGCNLMSDGRPIIGLSSIQLAELVWSVDEKCLIIPAHVWTPWFSMFGSKSGFDSIKECWGEFADRIYAVETGLSSDPAMNWRIKDFDNRAIVSFGDAHSPAKIGREATVFELEELSFDNICDSLRPRMRAQVNTNFSSVFQSPAKKGSLSINSKAQGCKQKNTQKNCISPRANANNETMKQFNNRILYTIEFHPEEGKYHYSGHRKCNVRQSPKETKKKGAVCHVCGKPLTLGVMYRVEELAGHEIKIKKVKNKNGLVGYYNSEDKKRPPYVMLVPLMEILSESLQVGVSSKKVQNEYENLIKNLGSEIKILTQIKLKEIESLAGARIAEGVLRVRSGEIKIEPGYDGVFGKVKIWPASAEATAGEKEETEQKSLF